MPSADFSSPRTVLVVCFGNLCRSPMAEGLMRRRLPANAWRVRSAGTHAIGGDPPTPTACEVVLRLTGLDISRQRSTPLSVDAIQQSDHIFTMSRRQALEAAALCSEAAPRIRLFGAFAPANDARGGHADPYGGPADSREVPDPMGEDEATYEECCRRLIDCADAAAHWLEQGAPAAKGPGPVADWISVP